MASEKVKLLCSAFYRNFELYCGEKWLIGIDSAEQRAFAVEVLATDLSGRLERKSLGESSVKNVEHKVTRVGKMFLNEVNWF